MKTNRTYASVSWIVEDILDDPKHKQRGVTLTREQAEKFLAKYESKLAEIMTESGWEAIDTWLREEMP